MNGKREKGNSKRARIINFAWGLQSPYCSWAVSDYYVDFATFDKDALKKVFQFCSALKLKFERSETQVFLSVRRNFKIYF